MGIAAIACMLLLILVSRCMNKFSNPSIKWYFDPMVSFAALWIVGYIIYVLPIYSYREAISLQATVFVIAAHTIFFAGTVCSDFLSSALGSTAKKFESAAAWQHAYSFNFLFCISIAGLVGLFSIAADALLTSSVSLAQRTDLSQARQETFASAMGAGPVGPFMSLEQFSAAGFLFVGLMMAVSLDHLSKVKRTVLKLACALTILGIMFNQLLIRGGRMDVFILVVFVTLVYLMSPQSSLRRAIQPTLQKYKVTLFFAFGGLTLAVLFLFAVVFVQGRAGTSSPLLDLAIHHRMGIAPVLAGWIKNSPVFETIFLSLSYLVVPHTTLSFYFDQMGGTFSNPYWGQYNFQYLSGFVLRRLDMANEWHDFWIIRGEIWAPLRQLGYGTNVWATILRDLAIDFGWWGALGAVFVIGFVSKMLCVRAISRREPLIMVAYSLCIVFLVFSFAHSMFFIKSVFPPFMYAVILFLLLSIKNKLKRQKSVYVDAGSRQQWAQSNG